MQTGQVTTLVHNFNWHNPSWDLFILAAWVLVSVIYAFAAGRGRVVSVLMCVYIAKLIVIQTPWLTSGIQQKISSGFLPFQQMAVFVGVFLVLFMFLGRYAFKTSADTHHVSSLIFGVVFSFLQMGLLINIILNYLPAATQSHFGPLINTIFIQGQASFIWLVLPLVFLIALGKYVSDSSEL